MASASTYNLLVIDDADQDKLLFNTAKLKQTIAIAKFKNKEKIINEINEIKIQISFLENSIQESIDDEEINNYNIMLSKLKSILEQKELNINNMSNPSVSDIKETHEIFLNSQFKPWVESTFEYSKVSVNSKPQFGESVEFYVPSYGNFISDMAIHIKISELLPLSKEDKVRYANMLGHKLIKKVKLFISNNLIDEYSGEFYNAYYDTYISKDKQKAWLNCIGQEIGIDAEMVADPVNNHYRETKTIYNGFQTLKDKQEEVELFIPLLFWFNLDKKNAILNNYSVDTIKIVVELENDRNFIACLDTVSEIYNEKYIRPQVLECELYTNHIFVSEEIQDIFLSRVGFNLIRIHKYAEILLDKNKDSISLLNYLKYPTEEIMLYARPEENEIGIDNLNTWNKNKIMNIQYIKDCVAFKDTDGSYAIGLNNFKIYETKEVFDCLELSFDGTTSYGLDSPLFFSSYLPLISNNVICKNNSVYYFPYNMMQRSYNPSGYVNLSKSKKINFYYESKYVEQKRVIKLYIHSMCINFLIFNNTAAMLNFNIS
jgi:hypothetical protein